MNIYDNIANGKYNNKLDYPVKPTPSCNKCESKISESDNYCSNCGNDVAGRYSELMSIYKEQRLQYTSETNRLKELFKNDCFEYTGVAEHPKAEQAFSMAVNRASDGGWASILDEFDELSTLLVA